MKGDRRARRGWARVLKAFGIAAAIGAIGGLLAPGRKRKHLVGSNGQSPAPDGYVIREPGLYRDR